MSLYVENLVVILAAMVLLWLASIVKRDASIADIFWGSGFVLIAWITFHQADGYWFRKWLILLATSYWGARLSLHIGLRNRGKGEDPRYRAMREQHGGRFWWVSLFSVFGLQGILLWVISLPVQAALGSPHPQQPVIWDFFGMAVWLVGFSWEAVADWQLARFKSDPANRSRVMRSGLWAWSRHPNYFGESLVWWGIFLIAMADPRNLWTIVGPITILFLLLRVSGVALTEKTIAGRRPEYVDYVRTTNAFFPGPPGKSKE
ncbi:MAG: DUF1295 domain-containing protein [Syntrophobacteraceae bacterium]|nr:DUF1295 domain-containing protein [Syntrophobacteraceae bacterium]